MNKRRTQPCFVFIRFEHFEHTYGRAYLINSVSSITTHGADQWNYMAVSFRCERDSHDDNANLMRTSSLCNPSVSASSLRAENGVFVWGVSESGFSQHHHAQQPPNITYFGYTYYDTTYMYSTTSKCVFSTRKLTFTLSCCVRMACARFWPPRHVANVARLKTRCCYCCLL